MTMALHPEVQRKAQDELDQIVGKGRLPDYTDLDSLPYIQALIKEVTRYLPTILAVGFSYLSQMES